ncbi:MAG: adenosylcobinamide-GDP ribazoletransferase [Pseudomonadota bacterium]
MRAFLIALQFLTRLPVRLRNPPSESELGRSLLAYPLVGLLIGGLLALLATALSVGRIPDLLAAALVLAAWTLVTGGLHLDGLADSADAWIGGHGERERTLAIMKDPRCGPMAVTTLVVILLLKFGALAALSAGGTGWPILLAPLLGRTALPLLFLTTPYMRPGGLGSALSAHLPRKAAAATVALVGIAVLAGFGWAGGLGLATALAMFLLLRRMMLATIDGTTGDTAGALVEMVETGVLVAMASAGWVLT